MYVYKVAKDYDFMYWATPLDEISKIEEVAERRAYQWGLESKSDDNFSLDEIASVIPAQFFAALSLQVTSALSILIHEHNFDFDRLSGIYVQRVSEVEAGTDVSFIVGFSSGAGKFFVCRNNMEGRLHASVGAELIGAHGELFGSKKKEADELIH